MGLMPLGGALSPLGQGRGVAVAAFDPSTISGLQLWLKADANVYSDAGSTLAVDGNSVQQWNDQSGNTRNASKNATAPIYKTNIQNGKAVIRWNGSTGRLDTTSYTVNQPDTFFIVVKFATTTGFPILFNGITTRQQLYLEGAAHIDLYAGGGAAGATTINTAWHVYSMEFNGASSNAWIDGAAEITNGNAGSNALSGGLMLGTDASGNFLNGDYAELLHYSGLLSTANRHAVEAYLKAGWATP